MILSFFPFARSNLSLLKGVRFIHPKLSLFSHPPTLFFKDSDFLIMYPSYGCEVSSFFSSMFLTGDFSWRCSRSFKFIRLCSHFLLQWIKFKLCRSYFFLPHFKCFSHTGAPLNHPLLAIHLFRSGEDISVDSSFHSQFTQVLLRMLSHSSHFIQLVRSFF